MPANSKYISAGLRQLQVLKFDFTVRACKKTLDLLRLFSTIEFKKGFQWKKYYQELLFLLAYPASKDIYLIARKEMMRVTMYLAKHPATAGQLLNSGLPSTSLSGSYSYYLNRSLLALNPGAVSLDSMEGDKLLVMQFLNNGLSGIEREMLSEEDMGWNDWVKLFSGNAAKLQMPFLIQLLERSLTGISSREAAFAAFKIFSKIKLDGRWELTSGTIEKASRIHFYSTGLLKPVAPSIFGVNKKLFEQVSIDAASKQILVNLAQRTIYTLSKETDPFTYAQVTETEYFTCDRGISIALFYMLPEKKLELECYCGYLLLKNNIPVAYGGGWVLGHQCRFGLNILPAFRGGESAMITVRLLNLFSQHFNVRSFVIEPFQLGKGNAEGIRSASFWFYYKLGFRSMQPVLLKLAQAEYKKIKGMSAYRSPLAVLKTLSGSVICLHAPGSKELPFYDINRLSLSVTSHIRLVYQNNRDNALAELSKTYIPGKKRLPFSVMVLLEAFQKGKQVHSSEVAALAALFKLKSVSEREFVLALQKQRRFLRILQEVEQ